MEIEKFAVSEIEELNYNLDQCGFPVKEEVILSPKETMDNFIEKIYVLHKCEK